MTNGRQAEQAPTTTVGALPPALPNPGDARDLRQLLEAVLEAVTLDHDTPDHAHRMEERADWVRTTLKGALAEDPAGIGWNTDFLRGRLRAEETQAAARAAQAAAFLATEQPVPTHHRCARCKWTFDPHDKRFVDSRRRHGDSPFCNRCVDLCQDSEIADHWCPVDDWNHQQPSEGGERS